MRQRHIKDVIYLSRRGKTRYSQYRCKQKMEDISNLRADVDFYDAHQPSYPGCKTHSYQRGYPELSFSFTERWLMKHVGLTLEKVTASIDGMAILRGRRDKESIRDAFLRRVDLCDFSTKRPHSDIGTVSGAAIVDGRLVYVEKSNRRQSWHRRDKENACLYLADGSVLRASEGIWYREFPNRGIDDDLYPELRTRSRVQLSRRLLRHYGLSNVASRE